MLIGDKLEEKHIRVWEEEVRGGCIIWVVRAGLFQEVIFEQRGRTRLAHGRGSLTLCSGGVVPGSEPHGGTISVGNSKVTDLVF